MSDGQSNQAVSHNEAGRPVGLQVQQQMQRRKAQLGKLNHHHEGVKGVIKLDNVQQHSNHALSKGNSPL